MTGDAHEARARFADALRRSLEAGTFIALALGAPAGGAAEPDLKRVRVRRLRVRDEDCLCFVRQYATRDVTKNLPVAEGIAAVERELAGAFRTAHLFARDADIHLDLARPAARALRRCAPTRQADGAGSDHDL